MTLEIFLGVITGWILHSMVCAIGRNVQAVIDELRTYFAHRRELDECIKRGGQHDIA